MPPNQETPEQARLRWKSKWDARTGTARAIGYPPPEKQQPGDSQQHATSPNLTSPQQATSSTMPMPSTQQVAPPDLMEVGRSKRGWESSDGCMHDGEFSGWDVVHEEVFNQLNDHGLVDPAFQRDAPAVDLGCWWLQLTMVVLMHQFLCRRKLEGAWNNGASQQQTNPHD